MAFCGTHHTKEGVRGGGNAMEAETFSGVPLFRFGMLPASLSFVKMAIIKTAREKGCEWVDWRLQISALLFHPSFHKEQEGVEVEEEVELAKVVGVEEDWAPQESMVEGEDWVPQESMVKGEEEVVFGNTGDKKTVSPIFAQEDWLQVCRQSRETQPLKLLVACPDVDTIVQSGISTITSYRELNLFSSRPIPPPMDATWLDAIVGSHSFYLNMGGYSFSSIVEGEGRHVLRFVGEEGTTGVLSSFLRYNKLQIVEATIQQTSTRCGETVTSRTFVLAYRIVSPPPPSRLSSHHIVINGQEIETMSGMLL